MTYKGVYHCPLCSEWMPMADKIKYGHTCNPHDIDRRIEKDKIRREVNMEPKEVIDPPRIVTEREIYDQCFGGLHETCMDIAIKEAQKKSKDWNIPIELFDISALTFQHYKMWQDKKDFIDFKKKEKQAEIDKRFGIQTRRE